MIENSQRRLSWIDFAKLIAIIAVMVDHTSSILYTNENIKTLSFFSVTVFIFLSGVTSFYSNDRHQNRSYLSETVRRLASVVLPYMAATFIYQIYQDHFFVFKEYVFHVVRFDIVPPFYFVAFYIQLVIIAPVLFRIILMIRQRRHKVILYTLVSLCVLIFSILSIRYTDMGEIYGGGRFLFGGSFLLVFWFGMLFASTGLIIRKTSTRLLTLMASSFATVAFAYLICSRGFFMDRQGFFGPGINPPGLTLFCYSIIIILFLYSLIEIMDNISLDIPNQIVRYGAKLGSYSLYIFLYHYLFLEVMESVSRHTSVDHIWIKRVIYLPIMLLGSIVLIMVYRFIKQTIQQNRTGGMEG